MSFRVPDGYKKLPPDMACRGCHNVWQDDSGDYYCCGKSKTLAGLQEIASDPTGVSSFQADLAKEIIAGTYRPHLEP